MTHLNYSGSGTSQCDLIMDVLIVEQGKWVGMPTLAHFSGAYAVHSRVAELRKRGHVIEQRSERYGRKVRSFYRLANPPTTE